MLSVDPLMFLEVEVGQPVEVGTIDGLMRRYIPITGGSVSGTYRGTIMPGGADWQEIRASGALEIDAHYVLDLEEGRVEVHSKGIRSGPPEILARLAKGESVPASDYYFRTAMRFRAASTALARLNDMLALARGERQKNCVHLAVYEVA